MFYDMIEDGEDESKKESNIKLAEIMKSRVNPEIYYEMLCFRLENCKVYGCKQSGDSMSTARENSSSNTNSNSSSTSSNTSSNTNIGTHKGWRRAKRAGTLCGYAL